MLSVSNALAPFKKPENAFNHLCPHYPPAKAHGLPATAEDIILVVSCLRPIGVGTGGPQVPSPLHFSAKIFAYSVLFSSKAKLETANDSPRREEPKSANKFIIEGLGFPQDEVKVSLAPPLLVSFLRQCCARPDDNVGALKITI